jgi:hypothetical protein
MSDNIMRRLITKETVASCVRERLNKSDAAERCGVSVKRFTKDLADLGMAYPATSTRTNSKTKADVDAVIDYIIGNGGSVSAAVRILEISTTITTIRKHIKRLAIDLTPYRHAYKEYGSWKVLPEYSLPEKTTKLLCECRTCGVRKHVSRHNLALNRSQGCMSFAANKRYASAVISIDGELEFESVAALLRHFRIDQGYQMTRLKLNKGELVTIGSQQFKLKEREL